jgi:hypothetical protein
MKHQISEQLLSRILAHLSRQPWAEVDPLIQGIRAEVAESQAATAQAAAQPE